MRIRRLAFPLLALFSLGCSDGDGSKPARLAWSADASELSNPWPSDRLLAAGNAGTPAGYFTQVLPDDTLYDAPRSFLEGAVAELASLGGYSVYAPILFPASSKVNAARVTGVHLFPEAGGDPTAVSLRWVSSLRALAAEPVTPLRGSTRYVVVVADSRLAPSSAFKQARDTDPALVAMVDLAIARGLVEDAGDVDIAFAFTTQRIEDDLVAAQVRIDSALGDDLLPAYVDSAGLPFVAGIQTSGSAAFDAIFAQTGASPANIRTVAQGVISAYEFRDASGAMDPALVSGSALTPGRSTVDFRLAVPAGTPPPNGWPVVIASHGVSGDSLEPLQRAYSFAGAGAATIGATATDHGWRGSILDFFDFTQPLLVRDGFRQSSLEIVQLERAIRNAHEAGTPPFDQLDPERITYFGNSFGGILGGGVNASSSHIDAAGFAVSGGRLPRLFDGETGGFLLAIFGNTVGLPVTDENFAPFLESFRVVAQWAIDPADPGALAPSFDPARPILIQMALGDTVFLNPSSEDLRLALDLPVLDAPADPFTGRGGLWIWDVTQHPEVPEEVEPHDLYWDLPAMRHQMEQFLLSDGTVLVDQ